MELIINPKKLWIYGNFNKINVRQSRTRPENFNVIFNDDLIYYLTINFHYFQNKTILQIKDENSNDIYILEFFNITSHNFIRF